MKRIAIIALSMAALTGCGNQAISETSIISEIPAETTVIVETEVTEKEPEPETKSPVITTSAEKKEEYKARDVINILNWMTGDIWNDGIFTVKMYSERGTNSIGQQIDIDFCIENLKLAYSKKDEYNEVIHALDDSIPEQNQLIVSWDKAIEQADILIDKITTETPMPQDESYVLETDLFFQYYDSFRDYCSLFSNPTRQEESGLPVFK